jgi:hypothetical protein
VHDISELKQVSASAPAFEPTQAQKSGEVSVQPACNKGGFGNKQASTLETTCVIYRDTLVHNVHVSVQEHMKKQKMYQKKVTKKRHQECIYPPELQYTNIYKTSVKRLGVFAEIT